jgi:RNA polymerase sigma-70 factor, ECF subfamily
MMLRLTDLATHSGPALCIEGRLTATGADLVRTAWQSRRSHALDLAWLTFADEAGASVLDELRRRGARLLHVPPFVTALLERGLDMTTDSCPPSPAAILPGSPSADANADRDRTLIDALKAGDEEAFERLVREHAGRLLAVARRLLRDPRDAEEVVQEAFTSAFRSLKTFRAECRLSTWLHRIVVNQALMRLRARRRRPEVALDRLLPVFAPDGHRLAQTAEPSPELALTSSETRRMVRAAIDQLPDAYRTVLLLRDIEEMDNQAVAAQLGITPNAAKIRLHRARQALVTLLDPSASRSAGRRLSRRGGEGAAT